MDTRPIILFFNDFFGRPPEIEPLASCRNCCEFTADRRRFYEASAVVFHIPTFEGIGSPRKRPGQLWVAWSMESAVNYPLLDDQAFMKNFDVRMTYEQSADVWCPYLPSEREFEKALAKPKATKSASASTVMLQSTDFDRSGRNAFARELMDYLKIDSFGAFLNNRQFETPDRGRETKLSLIANYKFCIGFENAIAEDYVTEKFFDPLLSGSVPVYRGAPNVDAFAPGPKAFVNVFGFTGARELAEYLNYLDNDDEAYRDHLAWREVGLSEQLRGQLARRGAEPFCRLCKLVVDKLRSIF